MLGNRMCLLGTGWSAGAEASLHAAGSLGPQSYHCKEMSSPVKLKDETNHSSDIVGDAEEGPNELCLTPDPQEV